MALPPKCPEGFEWVPQFGNGKSCFKRTEENPIECNPNSPTSCYYDLTITDSMCLKDNSRPFVTENSDEIGAMKNFEPAMVPISMYHHMGIVPYRSPVPQSGSTRSNSEDGFIYASKNNLVDVLYSHFPDNGNTITPSTSSYTSLYLWYNGPYLTGRAAKGTSAFASNFGICQYTECTSMTGAKCKFPFKYKGRLYDTCITVDDKGLYPGAPWCSTQTDEFGIHVEGNEDTCSDSCRVTDCPVGYYWMPFTDSCYKVFETATIFE